MHKLLIIFIITLSLQAKSQNFSGPESVEYDETRNCYYVSNTNSQQIIKVDSQFNQTVLYTWSGSITGPHGIERIGDTLYCCTGASVRGIDLTTNTEVLNINLGATFLNGITHGPDRILYITDYNALKLYRLNTLTQQFNVMVNNIGPTAPNGVIYDAYDHVNPRLVVAFWSSNAQVKAVNLADSTVSLLTTTSLTNIDGICKGTNGRFFLASWSPDRLTEYDSTFTNSSVLVNGLSNPADICYNFTNDTIAVPNTGNNTVTYHYAGTTVSLNAQEINDLILFPNPVMNELRLTVPEKQTGMEYLIYDLQGRVLQNGIVDTQIAGTMIIPCHAFTPGLYIVSLPAVNIKIKFNKA